MLVRVGGLPVAHPLIERLHAQMLASRGAWIFIPSRREEAAATSHHRVVAGPYVVRKDEKARLVRGGVPIATPYHRCPCLSQKAKDLGLASAREALNQRAERRLVGAQ